MIGRLTGTVAETAEVAIIDVHGVGYEVHMPSRDLQALTVGEPATLTIETHVREDMIRLYGFRDQASRDWFRLLQSVQGVGAKVALGVLSVLPPDDLAAAIATGDRTAISRAPGVGKRVAERIATELKSKAPAAPVMIAPAAAKHVPADEPLADAVSALVNLGYDEARARATVAAIRAEKPAAPAADLIRAGLKALAA
ncbi:MAG: Holliday junction branch migration protein RuvA [Pseudomonadota bacterium]